jgi:predicted metal-binding protein
MDILKDKIEKIKKYGATRVEIIEVKDITFHPELRKSCEMNQCGAYKKNWTCPPHVGDIHDLISELSQYKRALVFQSVYEIEDSFDIEGMDEAQKKFQKLTNKIAQLFAGSNPPVKVLGAGGCRICEVCGAATNTPCKFPAVAYSSLEAYGILVSDLAKTCGMNYINGQNTVTYFGAIFQ